MTAKDWHSLTLAGWGGPNIPAPHLAGRTRCLAGSTAAWLEAAVRGPLVRRVGNYPHGPNGSWYVRTASA